MHPVTMRFMTPAAEQDFLRFRTTGRVAIVCATFAAHFVVYAVWFVESPGLSVASLIVAHLLGLLAEIAFVACSRPTSIGEMAARAARHERISAAAILVANVVRGATTASRIRQRCGASLSRAEYRRCASPDDFPSFLAVATVMIAPRLTYIVPSNLLVTVVYVLSTNLSYMHFDPIDYVSDSLVLGGYMLGLGVAAWVKERRERAFFLTIVELQRASAALDKQREAIRAVLATALPAPLLHDGALSAQGVAHHSMHATVAVTDIYGFSAWSTWHLEVHVVHILHAVMAVYDIVVSTHAGVERAMTYGDSYVVCCGLLEPHDGHADAVMRCADELGLAARSVSRMVEFSQFHTRTSIFSGELRGTSIGTTSRRYAVAGPAFDEAVDWIGTCERNGVVRGADNLNPSATGASGALVRTVVGRDTPTDVVVTPETEQRQDPASDGQPSTGARAGEAEVTAPLRFSPLWLAMDTALPEPFVLGVADGVVPAVIITALLTTVLAEHASSDPQRHHSRQPVGLGLLCAGFLSAWAKVGALVAAKGALPVAVATACKVIPRALTAYGLVLLGCYYAKPGVAFCVALGFLCRFDGAVPWMLQVFFVLVSTIVPAMINIYLRGPGSALDFVVFFLVVPVMCVVHRYFTVRADCEQTVAAMVAAINVAQADEQSRLVANVLAGLLPPHAIANFSSACTLDVATSRVEGATHIQSWAGLSVLQVKLRTDGRQLKQQWDCIGNALSSANAGGLLELVQASGDRLLIAGPFVKGFKKGDEGTRVESARQMLAFLRELSNELKSVDCTFTAVATCGTAYGALVGAANMTYRIFGAAVRESDAILAAAPLPIGAPRNVAFASDSFRQQERNFAVNTLTALHDAAMSTALEVSAAASVGGDRGTASDESQARTFGTAVMWRAVGLGAVPISVVYML
jgi:hypothetical protein